VSKPIQIPGAEIGDVLGHGAHSIVYRGTLGGTPCAIKVPRRSGRWTKWVYREAVALARVRHPALPTVLAVGEANDLPYLVMELVEGETLADRLRRGPLEELQVLDMVLHLTDALAAVHDAGLVHRDVKPRNIILENDGGWVRLVDFGFAAPGGMETAQDPAGTPGYTAPEQFASPFRVDGRADLYALGRVILDSCGSSRDRAVGRLSLATIAEHLVQEDPEARYPDARALHADLVALRTGGLPRGPRGYSAAAHIAPLFGRREQLKTILATWEHARRDGGRTLVVSAVRGAGKSHLLGGAVAKLTTDGARVLQARCREGDAPHAALRQLLESFLFRDGRSAPVPEDLAALRGAAERQLAAVLAFVAPRAGEALGVSPPAADVLPDSVAEAVAGLLLRLAERAGGIVVVVDDLQWIDPGSRSSLTRLAHRVHQAPLLLLCGTREERCDFLLDTRTANATIGLDRFGDAEVSAQVEWYLGQKGIGRDVVRRIAGLADGTPLGVLEVLRAFLDVGALRPAIDGWRFDEASVDRVTLPQGAVALLVRRVAELPPATRRVLEVAAVIGITFPDRLLASAVKLEVGDLEYALDEGRRAELVARDGPSDHRFVHDAVREMLVAGLGEGLRSQLSLDVARVLDAEPRPTVEQICATAHHYAHAREGSLEAAAALRTARAAATAVLARFDNEMALRFLEMARLAAELAKVPLDHTFHRDIAEAHLRVGALEASFRSFDRALALAPDALTRARLHGRIAWGHQVASDPDRAWAALSLAFSGLGATMPVESALSAGVTLRNAAAGGLRRLVLRRAPLTKTHLPAETELLCDLHLQNARLGGEYGKPFRMVQSALEAKRLTDAMGPSRPRAKALALHGFVISVLGRKGAGAEALESATRMANDLEDPLTIGFVMGFSAATAAWAGKFDESLAIYRTCIEHNSYWFELNEYCNVVMSVDAMEAIRGRARESWEACSLAVERLRRSASRPIGPSAFAILRSNAALATLGRRVEDEDDWLAKQVELVSSGPGVPTGLYGVVSWGPRVRAVIERGDVDRLDALVEQFDREGHDPGSVHVALTEYYVAVAHGRLHQCLIAGPSRRAQHLPALRRSADQLRKAAKLSLIRTHSMVIDACVAWFEGDRKADRLLADAERLATQESCPWVLYAVARSRAHRLREEGKDGAARDQARVAELLASTHGAEPRARCVREEFQLPSPAPPTRHSHRSTASSASRRARRQLASLLHVVRAPQSAGEPGEQAAGVLDEILRDIDAETGIVLFEPEHRPNDGARLLLGRTRGGKTLTTADGWRERLLREVRTQGKAWPDSTLSLDSLDPSIDARRVFVLPLFLHDASVGALCLERRAAQNPFTAEDRELLELLSYHVPISLEITRLLAERAEVQASMQQIQKMDAVGQLAGGVAHDFNNMLMVVKASIDQIASHPNLDSEVTSELDVIAQAADRAAELTRRLLGFSRHQPVALTRVEINDTVNEVLPMLKRIVGERVKVETRLSRDLDGVDIDRAAFAQVLVNLTVNARDAMPSGGTLAISSRNVTLDDNSVRRGLPNAGAYVQIEVSDTGEGMTPEVRARVFDPFFTTKPTGGGTGLGLTMVYAFAKNSGGHVMVESELGRGTTFRFFLPRSRAVREWPAEAPSNATTMRTLSFRDDLAILLVDDDQLVRDSVRRVLHRAGYRVLVASGGIEALQIMSRLSTQISLVILDVMMPGMTGPELAARFVELKVPAKVLFVSGFAPGNLPVEIGDITGEMLLQKPFGGEELLKRVGRLLES